MKLTNQEKALIKRKVLTPQLVPLNRLVNALNLKRGVLRYGIIDNSGIVDITTGKLVLGIKA